MLNDQPFLEQVLKKKSKLKPPLEVEKNNNKDNYHCLIIKHFKRFFVNGWSF